MKNKSVRFALVSVVAVLSVFAPERVPCGRLCSRSEFSHRLLRQLTTT